MGVYPMLYWLRSSFWICSNAWCSLSCLLPTSMTRPPVCFGQLLHVVVAAVAEAAVESAIGNQDHVADGVGLLRGFDGVLDPQAAALVFAVGKDDHCLASDFILQLLVSAEIDGVIQQRAPRRGRNWTATQSWRAATHTGIDLHLIKRAVRSCTLLVKS